LSNRNFSLQGWKLEPRLEYQPGRVYRISLYYRYSDYANGSSGEYSSLHDAGIEARYSFPGKGLASARLSRNAVSFNGDPASPAGWEMLGSLLPGINYTWTVGVQRNLRDNLQLNLMYEGRKLPGRKLIHTGSVQLRAFF
jgi:opacity protein-like surface antigen